MGIQLRAGATSRAERTQARRTLACRLQDAGLTTSQIAARLGVTRRAADNYLRAMGRPFHSRGTWPRFEAM